jgi:hypothetical protein
MCEDGAPAGESVAAMQVRNWSSPAVRVVAEDVVKNYVEKV